ncbi:MAG: type II toxin-antitoxin system VapC family toxin [Deltaproteobacteria bacterium]|nr:type II toxin-antitoxin system VapC family toxin [Deltaproteobacteria bacterium]
MMVADSDVLIDYLRGKGAAARIELELSTGRLATTVVNAFELRAGAPSAKRLNAVEILLDALHILPLDDTAASEAAEIQRELSASGAPIALADCLIAGICRRHGGVLITRNRKHFERVPRLALSSSVE